MGPSSFVKVKWYSGGIVWIEPGPSTTQPSMLTDNWQKQNNYSNNWSKGQGWALELRKCCFFATHHRCNWLGPDLRLRASDIEKSHELNLTWALTKVCVCLLMFPWHFCITSKDLMGTLEAILQTEGSRCGGRKVGVSRMWGWSGGFEGRRRVFFSRTSCFSKWLGL